MAAMRSFKLVIKVVFLFVLCRFNAQAQAIQLVFASVQKWSGGVAGRYGSNYTFVINCTNLRHTLMPDTIWINNESIPLFTCDSVSTRNTKISYNKNKSTARIEFNVGTQTNEFTGPDISAFTGTKFKSHCPVACKGVALIGYKYGGNERYYSVGRITKIFPPINYP